MEAKPLADWEPHFKTTGEAVVLYCGYLQRQMDTAQAQIREVTRVSNEQENLDSRELRKAKCT